MSGPTEGTILRLWDPENRRCAQCWGPVQLAVQWDGSAALVCPNGCEPGGHVSDIHVRYEQMTMESVAREAARNYPDLAQAAGIRLRTTAEKAADAAAMWGAPEPDQDMKAWAKANRPERTAAAVVPAKPKPPTRAERRRRRWMRAGVRPAGWREQCPSRA